MSNKVTLEVSSRAGVGKGVARSIRRNGLIPAVIYGNKQAPISIELDPRALIVQTKIKGFKTRQFVLKIDGKEEELTLCHNIQYHKVKDTPLHVDFLRIDPKKEIEIEIPLEIIGTDVCKGIKLGGLLNIVHREVKIKCLPSNIPESIVIDITDLEIADSITMADLKLPSEAKLVETITEEHNPTVLTIAPPQEEEVISDEAPEATEVPATKVKDEKEEDKEKDKE